MINIRKRKMKKHQRKKLLKKMKFVFFKLRYKKAQKKEKAFQVNLYHVFILGD